MNFVVEPCVTTASGNALLSDSLIIGRDFLERCKARNFSLFTCLLQQNLPLLTVREYQNAIEMLLSCDVGQIHWKQSSFILLL
jgi:hypothetical protein